MLVFKQSYFLELLAKIFVFLIFRCTWYFAIVYSSWYIILFRLLTEATLSYFTQGADYL